MERQTRMLTVLGCLVFSMTGMSALLTWLDPSLPQGHPAYNVDTLERLASEAVADAVWLHDRDWLSIEIDGGQVRTGAMLLSARSQSSRTAGGSESESWHFHVAVDGRTTVQDATSLQAGRDAIQIFLDIDPQLQTVTYAQAVSTRALLASLKQTVPADIIPVVSAELPREILY
ncbi:MAG: hypothetical protein ACPGXK_00350 [Phycisphaerae bacterium]